MNYKIAAIIPDYTACAYYRIIIPFIYAKQLGVELKLFESCNLDSLSEYDVIISQRQISNEVLNTLIELKKQGKIIIAEIDDILDRIEKYNPAYNIFHSGSKALDNIFKNLKLANGITTTTEDIKLYYSGINKNICVLPNYIDFELRKWPNPHKYNENEIKVGWSGSISHIEDIRLIAPTLCKILKKYPNVKYMHYGNIELLQFMIKEYKLPIEKISVIALTSFMDYPSGLDKFDIGLCPIVDNVFNRGKSHLKAMEYCAAGIPFIASNVSPYKKYTTHGYDGFIAKTEEDWFDFLCLLIEDKEKRNQMSEQAYEKAKNNHDIKNHINEWVDCWENNIYKKQKF
jgi:glycosyltransferase involved in cell wall biosynthesis